MKHRVASYLVHDMFLEYRIHGELLLSNNCVDYDEIVLFWMGSTVAMLAIILMLSNLVDVLVVGGIILLPLLDIVNLISVFDGIHFSWPCEAYFIRPFFKGGCELSET